MNHLHNKPRFSLPRQLGATVVNRNQASSQVPQLTRGSGKLTSSKPAGEFGALSIGGSFSGLVQ